MGFQRRSERLNGVLLLDALGEDIPEGGSNICEGSLAVPLCLGIPGPGNIKERSTGGTGQNWLSCLRLAFAGKKRVVIATAVTYTSSGFVARYCTGVYV